MARKRKSIFFVQHATGSVRVTLDPDAAADKHYEREMKRILLYGMKRLRIARVRRAAERLEPKPR